MNTRISALLALILGVAVAAGAQSLPDGWAQTDIGTTYAGSSSYSSGTWTVTGSGSGVWYASDSFHFTYEQWTGDLDMIVRIATIQNGNAWAQAGIMVRQSLTNNSPYMFCYQTPTQGLGWEYRTTTGASATYAQTSGSAPQWCRIIRRGDFLEVYKSSNGSTWTRLGGQSIRMTDPVYVGFGVTNYTNGTFNTATFDNFSATSPTVNPPSPWTQSDISTNYRGSTSLSNNVWTGVGSGSGIWSSSDGFHYTYQQWSGDLDFSARISAVTGGTYAQDGIMVRQSLAAGAQYVFCFQTPSPVAQYSEYRATAGASPSYTQISSAGVPQWCRIKRTGDLFQVYRSSDGVNWTSVSSVSIHLTDPIDVGFASTNYGDGGYSTFTIDNVNLTNPSAVLPSPWQQGDVGTTNQGNTTYNSGSWTVTASGSGLWGATTDGFHFTYQQWNGDLDLKLRVAAIDNSNAWAQSGAIVRQSLASNAAYEGCLQTSGHGQYFEYRSASGSSGNYTQASSAAAPEWCRILRHGDQLDAYVSSDGSTWTRAGTVNIHMTDPVYVGFAVSSNTDGSFLGSTLDNVTVATAQSSAPYIQSMSPTQGPGGTQLTIAGGNFGSTQGSSTVAVNGLNAQVGQWAAGQIVVTVPNSATTGPVVVVINGIWSNSQTFTVDNPTITSVSPNNGTVGTQVTVAGSWFGSSQGSSAINFNGQAATTISNWSDTSITATVPITATTGPVTVVVSGTSSNSNYTFTVPAPTVAGVSPTVGSVGTQVTVTGSGFQANQRDSTIKVNGTTATVVSWSDTQIVAAVPAGATTGPVTVLVNGIQSNTTNIFTVPNPQIASLTPPSGAVGGSITIDGSGFFYPQPSGSQVSFNGAVATVTSWSDSRIVATVPAGVTSGSVTVTVYSVTSNGVPFTVDGAPTIAAISPSAGPIGSPVTISGTGFGQTRSNSTVDFNGVLAGVTSWSDTQITANVPVGATSGTVRVRVASLMATGLFTVNSTYQLTDSNGNISSYTSVMVGGKWRNSDVAGPGCATCTHRGVSHAEYDSKGNVLSRTDALGRMTSFTYDSDGNVASVSRQLDTSTTATTSYTYNSFGEVLTITDPLGNVTTNTYDANGNLTSVTTPAPTSGTAASVTQFAYDTKGELTQVTDPLNHITTITYTPAGLIATITDAQQNVTSYEYDLRGNRTAIVDAQLHRTAFAYDMGNRLTGITYPDTTTVSFGYDTRGRRTWVTDQNGKATTYTYDDADRLIAVTDPALNVTQYGYDLEGNLTSITDANSHTTSFAYDAEGRVTQTTFPSSLVEIYGYDAVGNLTSKTDRKGQTITYVYDALNRLTHKSYPNSTGVDYVYDLVGKIQQVNDPSGTYGFAYDNIGRLIGTTTQYSFLPGRTFSNSYTYDAASNRASLTADGSSTTYLYDTLNRMTDLTNAWAGHFTLGYDGLSRRTSLARPNGIHTGYSYDSLSRLLSVLHQAGGTTIDGANYGYDNAGNRTSMTNYLNNTSEQYAYDPLYQLTQVTQGGSTTESYSYDAVGNRLTSVGTPNYTYNASSQLTSTSLATFVYDYDGNTTSKTDASGTTGYTWDYENRLTSVTLPNGGGVVTFKYDPFGRRIQRISPTVTTVYAYDGANIVGEYDAAGIATTLYAHGAGVDEPLAMSKAGAVSYYDANGLGSITSLTDSTGSAVAAYVRDSFGKAVTTADTVANPYRYTGREWDEETGLYYYRARYYDPGLGRFLTEDSQRFFQDVAFYSYARSNPLNFVDATGMQADKPGLPVGTPQQFWKPFADGFAEAMNLLNSTTCAELFEPTCHVGPMTVGASQMFATEYRFLELPQGRGVAAQTVDPTHVQINTIGLYMTAQDGRIRLPDGSSFNLMSIADVQAFILLHELGHQLSGNTGFTPDVDAATNSAHSLMILKACFPYVFEHGIHFVAAGRL